MLKEQLGGLDPRAVEATLLAAAELAAAHTLPRFRSGLAVDNKLAMGFDPVTEADREAERAIRELIGARFPDHAIIGEEFEDKARAGRFSWIVDPIDGTRAFICGVPVWGTLIGLMVDGRAVAGLMAQPFTGELFLGLPGRAQYRRDGSVLALRTTSVTKVSAAKLTATTPDMFEEPELAPGWAALRRAALTVRYGLDCYGYCMLAAGHVDLAIEARLKPVDIAPLIPIIENAGGVVTGWDGGPAEAGGNVVAAANAELHQAALELIARA